MANTAQVPDRYEDYEGHGSPEDAEGGVGEGAKNLDARVKSTYEGLKAKRRSVEGYGEGEKAADEVLGSFKRGCMSIKGVRAKLYAGAMNAVSETEDEIKEIDSKIEEIRADRALYQEALKEIRGTLRLWEVGKKAKLAVSGAKEGVKAKVREMPHRAHKKYWEISKSFDEWRADLMKGDLDERYGKTKKDLNRAKNMEATVGKFYSKAMAKVSGSELEGISDDPEKKKKLVALKTAKGDEDFKRKWEELNGELDEGERGKFRRTLKGKLSKKEQEMVERLIDRAESIRKRPDVHDYQELKYLRDVRGNMSNGKRLYQGLEMPKIKDVDSWRYNLEQLYETAPNVAYMLCDTVNNYKESGTKLSTALKAVLTKGDKPNQELINKLKGVDPKSVNDLIKVNFHVKREMDKLKKEGFEEKDEEKLPAEERDEKEEAGEEAVGEPAGEEPPGEEPAGEEPTEEEPPEEEPTATEASSEEESTEEDLGEETIREFDGKTKEVEAELSKIDSQIKQREKQRETNKKIGYAPPSIISEGLERDLAELQKKKDKLLEELGERGSSEEEKTVAEEVDIIDRKIQNIEKAAKQDLPGRVPEKIIQGREKDLEELEARRKEK